MEFLFIGRELLELDYSVRGLVREIVTSILKPDTEKS